MAAEGEGAVELSGDWLLGVASAQRSGNRPPKQGMEKPSGSGDEHGG